MNFWGMEMLMFIGIYSQDEPVILKITEIMGKAQYGGIQWKRCTVITIDWQKMR